MTRIEHIIEYLRSSMLLNTDLLKDESIHSKISAAAQAITNALANGNKVISCGNGGSMCDAMHFASELTGKYRNTRDPLPALALSDQAAMSCIANDFNYTAVFSRQIIALGNPGDILLVISTSGKSDNILLALKAAEERNMIVIGLTGALPPNEFSDFVDIEIRVPCTITNHIQEVHIKIIHILVELIEKGL